MTANALTRCAALGALSVSLLSVAASAQDADAPPGPLDPALLQGLTARSIGPAAMSGRIGAVASVPADPRIVWAGAASGGLWKSTDAGVTFAPVFDRENCASIGAIAIDPRTPEVIWIGTGEGNTRNSASVGRGVYRSRDGGQTWTNLGLERTEKIHRIVLHPVDPDTAFVAALGPSWAAGGERGLYRTTDGGRSWELILSGAETVGCCDVVMDPQNPQKLFAGLWDHQRTAWSFRSGGPGSGLFRSVDGGDSWQRIEPHQGAPKGELGRSCFQVSPSEPRVVYALVEASRSALLRSDDGGFHFTAVNESNGIAPRPFYFCDIRVDPRDPDRVYNMHTVVDVSNDGGRSFAQLIGWGKAHPDHHAMWIDPTDPQRIVIGNDGGVYTSLDRGETWRHCANLPLAQFYHVAVDDDRPYNVYGGLQDNGSWRGPSMVGENGGIRNLHWQEVNFGDGFATLPDPRDSLQGYAMSQGGGLVRYDLRTGRQKNIRPPSPDIDVELRFHWNAAIAQDPFDPQTIYYGSQFVHRSTDRGESWEVVSPDLTTDDPAKQRQAESGGLTIDVTAAENHCTILTIAPSPLERGVLWAGTDDGRVHVTRDGGRSWLSVERAIPDLPANTWCPHIEAGKHAPGTAFVVFDDHRRFNWTPYVYRTTDYGATWTSIATAGIDGYVHCIEQDPRQADLLFVGTEFGLWFTVDGGAAWHRFEHGLPTCAARALVVHPTCDDLVIATHGRGIFLIDDITPLRTMTAALQQRQLHLFPIQDAILWELRQTPGARFPGQGEYRGENRAFGALLEVHVRGEGLEHPDPEVQRAKAAQDTAASTETGATDAPDAPAAPEKQPEPATDGPARDEVQVDIRTANGELVRTFRNKVKSGLNRIVWRFERNGEPGPDRDLRIDPPATPPGGRRVLPGEYSVTVQFRGEEQAAALRVLPDPRATVDLEAWQQKDALHARSEAIVRPLTAATQRLARCRKDLELVEQRLRLEHEPKGKSAADPLADIRKATATVKKELDQLEELLWGKKAGQGITRDDSLMAGVWQQLRALTRSPDAPNATELLAIERGEQRVAEAIAAADAFVTGPWRQFRTALTASGLALLPAAAEREDERGGDK